MFSITALFDGAAVPMDWIWITQYCRHGAHARRANRGHIPLRYFVANLDIH
jgi:hypothetical protein